VLAVNYYKRLEPTVQEAVRLIRDGTLGSIRLATGVYSGPLDAVGSHALDLLTFLLGPLTVAEVVEGDAGPTALLASKDGAAAVLAASGRREELVFEVDVIASEGRVRILDNCAGLEVLHFAPSERYGGYRELVQETARSGVEALPFLAMFSEVADVLAGDGRPLTSDGASALVTQEALEGIRSRVAA
jgi:predicted dehydrogenase